MKIKTALLFLCAFAFHLSMFSQFNIQLHYDFGKTLYKSLDYRPQFTSTVEYLGSDKYGGTYCFIDMDYNSRGVAGSYWELQRDLRFWKFPMNVHVEYHGGNITNGDNYFSFNNMYFAGASYSFNNENYTTGIGFIAAYCYIQYPSSDSLVFSPHNFKLSMNWYAHFYKNLFTFSGFMDFWSENKGKYLFLSEPQIWLNLSNFKAVSDNFHLSIGSELKLSYAYVGNGFYTIPTAAIKWTF